MTMAHSLDDVTRLTDGDDTVRIPGPQLFDLRNDGANQCISFPRALEPLIAIYPNLKELVHEAVQSANAVSFVFGGLSRHEAASIWFLLNCSVQRVFADLKDQSVLPLVEMVMRGLCKLPMFSGNLWHVTDRDVTELYPLGQVFTWPGFLKCSTGGINNVFGGKKSQKYTIFNIETSSARITAPFADTCKGGITVVILPDSYFQVMSITIFSEEASVVHVRETIHPDIGEIVGINPNTVHSGLGPCYWDRVFEGFSPNSAARTALRVMCVGFATADVALHNSCLERLSQILNIECSMAERNQLVSQILTVMKQYEAYISIQSNGCAGLKALCWDQKYTEDWTNPSEILHVVVEAMERHPATTTLVLSALALLGCLCDVPQHTLQVQRLTEVVLSCMRQHVSDKRVQYSGCLLLDKLAVFAEFARSIANGEGSSIIVNLIRLHRGDPSVSNVGWRLLLRLVLNNNVVSVQQDDHGLNITNLREILSAYNKDADIQEEGMLLLRNAMKDNNAELLSEPVCLELVCSAIRGHSQNGAVVEASFDVLTELVRSSMMTNVAVADDGISSIIAAMYQNFIVPQIQERGCQILRRIAANGYRSRQKNGSANESCQSELQKPSLDHRLVVVESGGLGVILSAMKTHPDHPGVQRQGCLAITTLAVNSDNVVETNSDKEITAVLIAFSRHTPNISLQRASLRALEILVIQPSNRDVMVQKGGVEGTLSAMSSFSDCLQIQEGAMTLLSRLSETPDGAMRVYTNGGIEWLCSIMESHGDHEKIQTLACAVSANVYSNPRTFLIDNSLSGGDIHYGTGARYFDHIYRILKTYPDNLRVVTQTCKALCALPRPLRSLNHKLSPLVQAIRNHPNNVPLQIFACQALGKLFIFNCMSYFHNPSTNITEEAIYAVLGSSARHSLDRDLQLQCLTTLAITTPSFNYVRRPRFAVGSRELVHVVNTLLRHKEDRQIVVAGLKLLEKICSFTTPTLFMRLSLNQPEYDFVPVEGMPLLLAILREYIDDEAIMWLGGHVLVACFEHFENLPNGFCEDLKQFVAEIKVIYFSADSKIQVLWNSLLNAI